MLKNKLNFFIRFTKSNYSFLLHLNLIAFEFIKSLLLNNLYYFSKFILHHTLNFVFVCFSYIENKLAVNKVTKQFFYFIEKHLSLRVFNNLPVKFVNKNFNFNSSFFVASFFSMLLKKAFETEKRIDAVINDFKSLLESEVKQTISKILGVCLAVQGRVNSSDKSKKKVILFGSKTGKSFNFKRVDFCFNQAFTKQGVFGIKLWVFYKN